MAPTSRKEAEDTGGEQTSERLPVSGEESGRGAETQSQQTKDKASNEMDASFFPPLFDEITFLQDRLAYLERQARHHWKTPVEDAPPTDNEDGQKPEIADSDDYDVLQKHFPKAESGQRWVEMIEKSAADGAEERKSYGQHPYGRRSSMYHIRQDGALHKGSLGTAIYGSRGWADTHAPSIPGSNFGEDVRFRRTSKPFPHRGIRPPTSMRPFYETPVRDENRHAFPPRLSRKLGPPSRWDESDSEEWSSDTSTGSQDFKYFRARLRGDFEWELDRLNAQVMRYKKHQDKKKSRQLAIRAQEDKDIRKEALGAYDKDGAFLANLESDEAGAGEDKHGIRQLVPLGWSDFILRRALPLQHSFIIDVLIEEPKLSSGLRSTGRVKKDKESLKKDSKLGISAENGLDGKDDTVHGLKQSSPWTAQDPLPERIRINSKQIIDILSSIHGSTLYLDANEPSSVALLRPFKILHAYDKEIRDRCSELEEGGMKEPEQTQSVGSEENTTQADSDLAPEEESIDKPSTAKDKKRAAERTENFTSWEERRLQLEHLGCLRQFMDEFIGRKVAYLNSVNCIKISFSDVWHLFQPGTTVCSADGKQAYRVVNLQSKRHKGVDRWEAFWTQKHEKKRRMTNSSDESEDDRSAEITIKCVFIHFDGESFGPVIKKFHINKWDGQKEVTYLDIYPLRFHILKHIDKRTVTSTTKIQTSVRQQEVEEGVQALTRKLVDRGRVFLDVAAVRQMYYSGLAVDTRDEIESQVMVDFEEALAHESRRHWIPNITRLPGTNWKSKADEVGEGCTAECCWRENVHDDAYVETSSTEKFIDDVMAEIKDTPHKLPSTMIFPRSLEETKTGSNAFTHDELMIMSYSVFGFVLRDRTWGKCFYIRFSITRREGTSRERLMQISLYVAKLDLDCMSPVRAPENATAQMDDDFEEGGPGAFGQLVLPDGHKKMVLSLISQHFRNKESQESNDNHLDIVRGKGKSTRARPTCQVVGFRKCCRMN